MVEDAFVQKRLQDIRGLPFADVPRAKAELSKHCTAITLTPEGSTFRITEDWNLLGGRSDGAGGRNSTLGPSLEFRLELVTRVYSSLHTHAVCKARGIRWVGVARHASSRCSLRPSTLGPA
jgi:hypothetical protein